MPDDPIPTDPIPPDDALATWLADAARRMDPVPPDVVAAARRSFGRRALGADLAELAYDSVVDDDRLVGARGLSGPRTLTFEAPSLTIEVQVDDVGGRTLDGQLVPPQAGDIELRHPGGVLQLVADEMGRFRATGVPAGPVSLLCRSRLHPTSAVETDWVVL